MIGQRVILDVDVGTDDAVGLLLFFFAETLGMIKIDAITCTHGNTNVDNVAYNVMRILEVTNRTDIPVYKGAYESYIKPEINGDGYHGADGFGDLEWSTTPNMTRLKSEHAVNAIIRMVSDSPGEIMVLAVGPLTNIGLATMMDKNFYDKIKGLWVMGGNYRAIGNISPAGEFNFYMDPESAQRITHKTKKPITIVPWEAAYDFTITPEWRFNVLGAIRNPLLDIIGKAERMIYPDKSTIYNPADAVFATAFLDSLAIKAEELYPGNVELHGSLTRGQVVLDHYNSTTPNVRIIEKVSQELFKSWLLEAAAKTAKSFAPTRV